jgi:hypothetical protein
VASEAAVNSAIPATNMRRRPTMSPARAPTRSSPPKVSAYPLCTHDSSVAENPRACWILGSAAMTIETSSTAIA